MSSLRLDLVGGGALYVKTPMERARQIENSVGAKGLVFDDLVSMLTLERLAVPADHIKRVIYI